MHWCATSSSSISLYSLHVTLFTTGFAPWLFVLLAGHQGACHDAVEALGSVAGATCMVLYCIVPSAMHTSSLLLCLQDIACVPEAAEALYSVSSVASMAPYSAVTCICVALLINLLAGQQGACYGTSLNRRSTRLSG
jgi:hypothetical protein